MKASVLIVDDEVNVQRSLRGVLEDSGYEVQTAGSGEECLELLEKTSVDIMFLDVWLPGRDGLEVLEEIMARRQHQYVIMISGHGTIGTAVKATKLGAFDFIEKPLTAEKILLVLEHALRQQQLEAANRNLRDLLGRQTVMIGDSVPMQALRQQIGYAAPTEARILIYGENGTGKELVARLLHLGSNRHDQPFEDVNCAAIPEDLIESELFGCLKGAFTGASEDRKGKLELAHKGTLFLDEVGDMSLKTQAKLLRVLDELRFHPIGSDAAVEVDVRVIAATNKDLEHEISQGRFREDLFFRLNVIPFEVPPLRERNEDVKALAQYFLEHFCRQNGRPQKSLMPPVLKRLQAYRWPGNVRELKNVVERLVIMEPADRVEVTHLPQAVLQADGPGRGGVSGWQAARAEFEKTYLQARLKEHTWNISRTAAAIGMERTHLHRKLKAYKIKARS